MRWNPPLRSRRRRSWVFPARLLGLVPSPTPPLEALPTAGQEPKLLAALRDLGPHMCSTDPARLVAPLAGGSSTPLTGSSFAPPPFASHEHASRKTCPAEARVAVRRAPSARSTPGCPLPASRAFRVEDPNIAFGEPVPTDSIAFRPRGFPPPRRLAPPELRGLVASRCRSWGSSRFRVRPTSARWRHPKVTPRYPRSTRRFPATWFGPLEGVHTSTAALLSPGPLPP